MGNCCAKRRRDRSSPYVMYDDVLILVFNELEVKEMLPLRCVSNQFNECILYSLEPRKSQTYVLLEADLNRRLVYLKSITNICQRIEDLSLEDCYIDERVIAFINENVKHLKRLSLINCRIQSFSEVVATDEMKTFSKKPIELTIKQIDKRLDAFFLEDEEILALIRLFENIVKLRVNLKRSLNSEKLFEVLSPSLNCIEVFSKESHRFLDEVSNDMITSLVELKLLYFNGYLASEQIIRVIINSLNLKRFSFRCHELTTSLMQEMAKNQKELTHLFIYFSEFIEHKDLKNVALFGNVRHFLLQDPKINPNHFKQIIDMFPNIKIFAFAPSDQIQCLDNEENFNCDDCYYKTFEVIPRLPSLRHFITYFRSIGKQLFECLDRFPNLSYYTIVCEHIYTDENHDSSDTYNSGKLKDVLDYIVSVCEKNPRKVIKFELQCDERPFPSDFKRPRK